MKKYEDNLSYSCNSFNYNLSAGRFHCHRAKTDAPLKVNESNYTQSIDKNSNSYILKDCNGYLGVYKPDGQSPVMVFDTDISLLPEYDRAELSKGVYAKDYKELTRLIEDYIS